MAYHLRMILYRATLTNRTGLGPKEGEVSALRLNRDPIFLTGKFDPILHRTDSPVSNHWANLTVVNSSTSLPVNYILPDGTNRDSSLRTDLPVNLSTGRDRMGQVTDQIHGTIVYWIGPNWVSIARQVHRTRDS